MSLPKEEEGLKTELSNLMKLSHEKKSNRQKQYSKAHNEDTNPCIKESLMSIKCLDDNGYIRDNCEKYFTNYRNCREFWSNITRERKRAGITPYLPSVEDREGIRKAKLGL